MPSEYEPMRGGASRPSEAFPGAGFLVNAGASLLGNMLFGDKGARLYGDEVSGGMGRFRASDAYAASRDAAARAQAMRVTDTATVAAMLRRQEADRRAKGMADYTAEEWRMAQRHASQSVGKAGAASSRDTAQLATMFENVSRGMHTPEELKDAKVAAGIRADAERRAFKTRAAMANPFMAGMVDMGVRAAESVGLPISNTMAETYIGGGVFDALRASTSGYTGVSGVLAGAVATEVTKSFLNADGTVNQGFARGLSALDVADTMTGMAKRGLLDTSVISGRVDPENVDKSAQVSKIKRDLEQMTGAVSSLRDLFGSGKSVDELLIAFDDMTRGGLQSLSGGQVKALSAQVRQAAVITGLGTENMIQVAQASATRAEQMGLQGVVGVRAGVNAALAASTAIRSRSRSGGGYFGAQNETQLTGMLADLQLKGAASRDVTATSAFEEALSVYAADALPGTPGEAIADTLSRLGAAAGRETEVAPYVAALRRNTAGNPTREDAALLSELNEGGMAGVLRNVGASPALFQRFRASPTLRVQERSMNNMGATFSRQQFDIDTFVGDSLVASLANEDKLAGVAPENRKAVRDLLMAAFHAEGGSNAAGFSAALKDPERLKKLTALGAADLAQRGAEIFANADVVARSPELTAAINNDWKGFLLGTTASAKAEQARDLMIAQSTGKLDDALQARGIGAQTLGGTLLTSLMTDPDADRSKMLGSLVTGKLSKEDLAEFDTIDQVGRRMGRARKAVAEGKMSPEEADRIAAEGAATLEAMSVRTGSRLTEKVAGGGSEVSGAELQRRATEHLGSILSDVSDIRKELHARSGGGTRETFPGSGASGLSGGTVTTSAQVVTYGQDPITGRYNFTQYADELRRR